jgi:hypothetical protein
MDSSACMAQWLFSAGRLSFTPTRQSRSIVPRCRAAARVGTAVFRLGDVFSHIKATLTRKKMTFIRDRAALSRKKNDFFPEKNSFYP